LNLIRRPGAFESVAIVLLAAPSLGSVRQQDTWALILVGMIVMVPAVLKGAADLDTCPQCGEGTEIPEDASGSWNHCYNCRARIR